MGNAARLVAGVVSSMDAEYQVDRVRFAVREHMNGKGAARQMGIAYDLVLAGFHLEKVLPSCPTSRHSRMMQRQMIPTCSWNVMSAGTATWYAWLVCALHSIVSA